MKTYDQILDELVTDEYKRINPVAINIHRNAAKEYAKIWIDRFVEKIEWIDENIGGDILDIKNEIDEQ